MFNFTDEEILQMENTISSRIPFDNAYFMSVYTTCKELNEGNKFVNKGHVFARICEGLDFCGDGTLFKSEQFALLSLLDTQVDTKKLKPLATTRNIVINGLDFLKDNKYVSILSPSTYVNIIAQMVKQEMKELFIATMCDLTVWGKDLLKGTFSTKDVNENIYSRTICLAVCLAYIDTLMDMSNLQIEGHMFEARNRFGIVVGKIRQKFQI